MTINTDYAQYAEWSKTLYGESPKTVKEEPKETLDVMGYVVLPPVKKKQTIAPHFYSRMKGKAKL